MIGAIGGTLGLCIGLSFREVYSFILAVLEAGVTRIQKNPTKNQISSRWAADRKHVQEGHESSMEGVPDKVQDNKNQMKRIEDRLLKLEQEMIHK